MRTDRTVAFQNQLYEDKWLRIRNHITDCEVSESHDLAM